MYGHSGGNLGLARTFSAILCSWRMVLGLLPMDLVAADLDMGLNPWQSALKRSADVAINFISWTCYDVCDCNANAA